MFAEAVLTDNAVHLLEKRYLDRRNGRQESVDEMFWRVAGQEDRYADIMKRLLFLPNSPALFNSGVGNGCTSSACFVLDVDDDMGPLPTDNHRSIVNVRAKAVAIAKAGGGVGYYFGNLRPKGSPIKTVHRVACGPVAVLRDYHAISKLITQGGKRELAQMGVLPVWHPDVKDFIHCKDEDPQGLGSFNISVSWSDDWVKNVRFDIPVGAHYPLVSGESTDEQGLATKLWWEQCQSAWAHGCPGMLFHDRMNNVRGNPNPHLGIINGTNPCSEVPNRSEEPCSLGSLNLWRFVNLKTREIDYGMLEDITRVAHRLMNSILDRGVFPHPEITKAALLTRRLGLGLMGWADLLALKGVHYDTQDALTLISKVWGLVSEVTRDESNKIAKEKGPYPGYSDRTDGPCSHNETVTSIAPTGSISILANASSGIEPHYALELDRTTSHGDHYTERVPVHEYLDGFVPRTAHEIDWRWHVRVQAEFQKHCDMAISKTINMPNSATVQDVSDAYRMMYETGCKGGTVFRSGCRNEQVLRARTPTKTQSVYQNGVAPTPVPTLLPASMTTGDIAALGAATQILTTQGTPECVHVVRKMPETRSSITHKFRVADVECFMIVGLYEDSTPGEVFIKASRQGSTICGLLDSWAINFSVALQNGTPLSELCKHHVGTRFEPAGVTSNKQIPMCSSIPDYVARFLQARFCKDESGSGPRFSLSSTGQYCPDCGLELRYESGCLTCPDRGCGYSKCG
jgi:ribonucleoside-diphosphate reductase alpha chain